VREVSVELGPFRVGVRPDAGGAITRLAWRTPGGDVAELLRRWPGTPDPPTHRDVACFPMVPFAGRIDRGRIRLPEGEADIPLNFPDRGLAVHGFSFQRPWDLVRADPGGILLRHVFSEPGNPYRYVAEQRISAADGTVAIGLSVRAEGETDLPFGIGLHPWFDRPPGTAVRFRSAAVMAGDGRGLPLPPRAPTGPEDFSAGRTDLGGAPRDEHHAGWDGTAEVLRPGDDLLLALRATGAFRNLHLHVPADGALVCLEPTSHVPDAANRPDIAHLGPMIRLRAGETLEGSLAIRPATAEGPRLSPPPAARGGRSTSSPRPASPKPP
jgi:aldose 1-epimerase